MERLSIECFWTETKVIRTTNQKKKKYPRGPMSTQLKPGKPPKARENAGDQFPICFSFSSYWLKEWREFFWTNHRAKWSKTTAISDYLWRSVKNDYKQCQVICSLIFGCLNYWEILILFYARFPVLCLSPSHFLTHMFNVPGTNPLCQRFVQVSMTLNHNSLARKTA